MVKTNVGTYTFFPHSHKSSRMPLHEHRDVCSAVYPFLTMYPPSLYDIITLLMDSFAGPGTFPFYDEYTILHSLILIIHLLYIANANNIA